MTFIEFKKLLLDADITLPKFSKLIGVSEKNLQAYKKKGEVPNTIAVIVSCFAHMNQSKIDYRTLVDSLGLKPKSKKGSGFATKKKETKPMKNSDTESK
ncbi:hypothetical protein [Sulfurimonas sp. HSL3-2]|uniref:hypothetical protein n=1 Tax=Hydrocurvibacter mobilis TaxID=3131936 RepID=UPI0031F76C36